MRTEYYEQLRQCLEPETTSIHSKNKSATVNSPHGSLQSPNGVKARQENFRNQRPVDSLTSFDMNRSFEINSK